MPVSLKDRDGLIWLDGRMVPWREARLHVLSHGLHYATTIWDGLRVYDGRIFRLAEHTQRLFMSAKTLSMPIPFDVFEIEAAMQGAVKDNSIRDGYIRPVAWRDAESLVLDSSAPVRMAIAAWEMSDLFSAEKRERGIRLTVASWRRPPPECAPGNIKASGLYMGGVLAKREAATHGFDDALMLDTHGNIADATSANVFLVIDGALHTPLPDCFLDGITRQTVIEIARKHGIKTAERVIRPEELMNADEVFITGTAIEIMPVREVDSRNYPSGPVTRHLMREYAELVRA